MDGEEFGTLLTAIDAHLCTGRANHRACSASRYWQEHPVLTYCEIALLAGLIREPACLDEIARRLQRPQPAANDLIQAFIAVGLLEPDGQRYRASPAAALY